MTELLLRSVALKQLTDDEREQWPYTIPVIAQMPTIEFDSPVCFFVGENGSGKSTLLEGLAAAALLPAIGSGEVQRDGTLEVQRRFGGKLKLIWARLEHRGFFLRAEDFFGWVKRLARERAEADQEIAETKAEYERLGRSQVAAQLATGPLRASVADIQVRYGDVDSISHGQSFLRLFQSRLRSHGLYLLDEPESPLSPASQMALMAMIHDAVGEGSQFIIATHSPILLAYPGAQIINFDAVPLERAKFDDLDHVNLTRDFLANPQRYLRHVLQTEDRA